MCYTLKSKMISPGLPTIFKELASANFERIITFAPFGKEKDLKKCQEIINEISDSFLTNLSIKELIKIIRKQMG